MEGNRCTSTAVYSSHASLLLWLEGTNGRKGDREGETFVYMPTNDYFCHPCVKSCYTAGVYGR